MISCLFPESVVDHESLLHVQNEVAATQYGTTHRPSRLIELMSIIRTFNTMIPLQVLTLS